MAGGTREGGAAISAVRCGECRMESAPPQPVCPHCGSDAKLEAITLAPRGTLYSYTVVHVPPSGLEDAAPYALGIIEMEGGARITGRVRAKDPGALSIGAPVELSEIGEGVFYFEMV